MSNSIDARWETAKQELADAAAKAGIDPGTMAKIAGFESQYDPHARPIVSNKHAELNTVSQFDGLKAMSSAYGYGQFTDATWISMVREHGEKYGIAGASKFTDAQANAVDLRTNSALQAGMLAEFTKKHIDKGAELGGPNADANIYALHNLGDSVGATFLKALKAHPNERVDVILHKVIVERNPGLYGDGSRTVKEAYQIMGEQMDRYAEYAKDIEQLTPNHVTVVQPISGKHAHAQTGLTDTQHRQTNNQATLREGMQGDEIRVLQSQLTALGYHDTQGRPLSVDGHFGRQTKAAVEALQRDHHLLSDGIIGPLTRHQLNNQFEQVSVHPDRLLAQHLREQQSRIQQQTPVTTDLGGSTFATKRTADFVMMDASELELDNPRNPLSANHSLYATLQRRIPDASEDRLMQFTAACHTKGITADNLGAIHLSEQTMTINFASSWPPGKFAQIDLTQPPPTVQQSMQQMQSFDQQQAHSMAQFQAQQTHINAQTQQGPVPGSGPMR